MPICSLWPSKLLYNLGMQEVNLLWVLIVLLRLYEYFHRILRIKTHVFDVSYVENNIVLLTCFLLIQVKMACLSSCKVICIPCCRFTIIHLMFRLHAGYLSVAKWQMNTVALLFQRWYNLWRPNRKEDKKC